MGSRDPYSHAQHSLSLLGKQSQIPRCNKMCNNQVFVNTSIVLTVVLRKLGDHPGSKKEDRYHDTRTGNSDRHPERVAGPYRVD